MGHARADDRRARATSARRATTAPPRCATPSASSRPSRWRWCATSTRTPSTSSPTTTAARRSRRSCPRASRTCWSTARPASRSAWPPTSRRTTCARSPRASSGRSANPEAGREELLEALIERIKGPDFPTDGLIVGTSGIEDMYRTGRGSVTMRAVVDDRGGHQGTHQPRRHRAALPGQPRQPGRKIADLADSGRVQGIADVRDESVVARRPPPRDRAQARRRRPGRAQQPLQAHRAADQLQRQHAGARRRRAAHADPRRVHHATGSHHQIEVIRRRTEYRLRKAEERAHIYRGLVKALDALDDVIALIRRSPTVDEARHGLIDLLEIDELQANAILDMQLRRLAALERQKIIDELAELEARDRRLQGHPRQRGPPALDRLRGARRDRREVRRRPAHARSSPADGDLSDGGPHPRRGGRRHDHQGRLRQAHQDRPVPRAEPRRQGRAWCAAARRATSSSTCSPTTSHHWILFFTTAGRVYRAKAYQLPEAGRDAKGGHVAGLLSFQPDEEIAQVLAIRDYEQAPYLVLATKTRPGQEDPARRLQQPAPGRRHRDQLPRRGRRADRRRAGLARGRPAADLAARRRRSASAPTTSSCDRWAAPPPASPA